MLPHVSVDTVRSATSESALLLRMALQICSAQDLSPSVSLPVADVTGSVLGWLRVFATGALSLNLVDLHVGQASGKHPHVSGWYEQRRNLLSAFGFHYSY